VAVGLEAHLDRARPERQWPIVEMVDRLVSLIGLPEASAWGVETPARLAIDHDQPPGGVGVRPGNFQGGIEYHGLVSIQTGDDTEGDQLRDLAQPVDARMVCQ